MPRSDAELCVDSLGLRLSRAFTRPSTTQAVEHFLFTGDIPPNGNCCNSKRSVSQRPSTYVDAVSDMTWCCLLIVLAF